MRTQKIRSTLTGLVVLLFVSSNLFAQFNTAEEAKDVINDHLSHSFLQKIDPDGTVTMNAPSEKIKFNLNDVSFNYNGGNNDDRVRVACDNCIEHYEHKNLTEKTSRQSFLCESEKEANMVINAFKFLKKKYASGQKSGVKGDRKLITSDSSFSTKTVSEAIDFINENLSFSMITGIDDAGKMSINAPEETYQVDLAKAEFAYNDESDGAKVRIYGDFCIGMKEGDDAMEMITRKSFQTRNRVRAYKVITVLYYLKCTYAHLDPANISGLKNLSAVRVNSYTNVAEAIDYINARLSYSIILGVDRAGNVTLNAPEEIYRFNLNDVKMSKALNHKIHSDWFSFFGIDDGSSGVLMECKNCISKYESPDSQEKIDEQVFQCGSVSDIRDVLKAFGFIRNSIKK
jgi:hypothetical protein